MKVIGYAQVRVERGRCIYYAWNAITAAGGMFELWSYTAPDLDLPGVNDLKQRFESFFQLPHVGQQWESGDETMTIVQTLIIKTEEVLNLSA